MNTLRSESRRTRLWLVAFAAVLAAPLAPAALKQGDVFPDVTAHKLEGPLPGSLKGKVVLVDFWASWCGPCAQSFPALEDLYQRYKDRGLVILAVSVDEKAGDMQAFLKKHPATFPVVRDAEHKLVAAVDVATMPSSFVLDTTGKVRFVHAGFRGDSTRKEYAQEIESLLKEAP